MSFTVRAIQPSDNFAAARVIKSVMPEFGCVGPGYSIEDPEMNDLFAAYTQPRCNYYVAEYSGTEADFGRDGFSVAAASGGGAHAGATLVGSGTPKVIACGGYAPLTGGDPSVCELRKMYALPAARGLGIGRRLLEQCLADARSDGYKTMYLESVAAMTAAARFYKRQGFTYIDGPMGATGHNACDRFMTLPL